MYVAVKGGARAIEAAHEKLSQKRRGNPRLPELEVGQIKEQLYLSVSRVMAEASLYAPRLAALAVKQAAGDLVEAVFLLRAARGTYPSFGYSEALDTSKTRLSRRISATWKDLPGGQILGPTFDYTHRLLDFDLEELKDRKVSAGNERKPAARIRAAGEESVKEDARPKKEPRPKKRLSPADALLLEDILEGEEDRGNIPGDISRETQSFPMERSRRLQTLARADEGFLLSLAYSTQRGFGSTHPFVNEMKIGMAEAEFTPGELGFPVVVGEIEITECETVNQFMGAGDGPKFTRGYSLLLGNNERKALSAAIVDRSLRADELGELKKGPAQDQEFVLAHGDSVEASGFVSHLKLPHYVDFQAELSLIRDLRKMRREKKEVPENENIPLASGKERPAERAFKKDEPERESLRGAE
jgi:alpha-D-ribose 1-methylphosphonate 5-triphosphate synthase subunit PhnI